MNKKIIAACEAFSTGNAEKALPFISDDVEWHIIGDHSIVGKAGVEETCKEAAEQGNPNFENGRIITSKSHIIIEGQDFDTDVHYCDIYTIEAQEICEITSYCLAPAE